MGVGTKQELKFTFLNDKEGNSVKQPSETPGNHLSEVSISNSFWFSMRYLMRYLDNNWRIGNISSGCYISNQRESVYVCMCVCVCVYVCMFVCMCICVCVCVCVCVLSLVEQFVTPWEVGARFFCQWNFPGKDTGVVTISYPRKSSWPRDQTCFSWVSFIGSRFFTNEPPGKP